jgi:LysM repeat protein
MGNVVIDAVRDRAENIKKLSKVKAINLVLAGTLLGVGGFKIGEKVLSTDPVDAHDKNGENDGSGASWFTSLGGGRGNNEGNTSPETRATKPHTVVKGDILFNLARDYGTTVPTLLDLNPNSPIATNPNLLLEGWVINVPAQPDSEVPPQAAAAPTGEGSVSGGTSGDTPEDVETKMEKVLDTFGKRLKPTLAEALDRKTSLSPEVKSNALAVDAAAQAHDLNTDIFAAYLNFSSYYKRVANTFPAGADGSSKQVLALLDWQAALLKQSIDAAPDKDYAKGITAALVANGDVQPESAANVAEQSINPYLNLLAGNPDTMLSTMIAKYGPEEPQEKPAPKSDDDDGGLPGAALPVGTGVAGLGIGAAVATIAARKRRNGDLSDAL